jgi:K+-sensing histidine kinase KdpD
MIIQTDEEWLWQMMLNLLTNACKFTSRGTIELKISLQNAPEESVPQQLLVEVVDTGEGVQPEKMNKIFEAFAQIQNEETSGTGLGLYESSIFIFSSLILKKDIRTNAKPKLEKIILKITFFHNHIKPSLFRAHLQFLSRAE